MNRLLTACSCLPLLFAACDGGGSRVAAPIADAQVTAESAQALAGLALGNALGLTKVAATGTGVLQARIARTVPRLDLGKLVAQRLQALLPTGGALPVLVTRTENGPLGGSLTVTWDDKDGDEKTSTGDTFAITFAAYAEQGFTLNGLMVVDRVVVAGDPSQLVGSWRISARLQLTNLLVDDGTAVQILDGSLAAAVEKRQITFLLTIRAEGPFANGTSTLLDGSTLDSHRYRDESVLMAGSGAAFSEGLGTVRYVTKEPFRGYTFDPFPTAGELEIAGSGGAKITVTVVDGVTVTLETDVDGDGTVDDTRTVNWADL